MEALAMASISYGDFHKYLDEPSYTKESTYSTTSPLEILHKIAEDKRFDGLFDGPDVGKISWLLENHGSGETVSGFPRGRRRVAGADSGTRHSCIRLFYLPFAHNQPCGPDPHPSHTKEIPHKPRKAVVATYDTCLCNAVQAEDQ
jgi:hypothetical protein